MTQLCLEGIVNGSAKAAAQKLADIVDRYDSANRWGVISLDPLRTEYKNCLYLHLTFSYTDMYHDDTSLGEFACFVGRHEDDIPHLPPHHPRYRKYDGGPICNDSLDRLQMASVAAGAIAGTASHIGGYAPLFALYIGMVTTLASFAGLGAARFIGNSIGRLFSRFKDPSKNYVNEIRRFVDEEIHLREDQEVMSKRDL